MKKLISIIVISLLFTGCSSKKLDIEQIMDENEYVIIDVRTNEEYETSHVKDSINIPYDEIDETIEISQDTIIFVYCQSGRRSNIAKDTLNDLGYTVYDLGAYESITLEKE